MKKRAFAFLLAIFLLAATLPLTVSAQTYTLTLVADDGGEVETSTGLTEVAADPGDIVTLVAEPFQGYRFVEWQVISGHVGSLEGNELIMDSEDVTVKGVFEQIPEHTAHPVCGVTCTHGEGGAALAAHAVPTWTPWGDDEAELTSMPTESGYYVLMADITLSDAWRVSENKDIDLCLNGFVLAVDGSYEEVIDIREYGKLHICDCDSRDQSHLFTDNGRHWVLDETADVNPITVEGGVITGGENGGIRVDGELYLYGGTIAGNTESGGVYMYAYDAADTSAFYMYGGAILGNFTYYSGGGVFVNGWESDDPDENCAATFYMYGGLISHNLANEWGGGVCNAGIMEMSGGSITGNASHAAGGGISNWRELTVSGEVVIKNNTVNGADNSLQIHEGHTVTVGDLHEDAMILVTAPLDTVITNGGKAAAQADRFGADDPILRTLEAADGELRMILSPDAYDRPHTHSLCGERCVHAGEEAHDDVTFMAWTATDAMPAVAGRYYLTADVVLDRCWTVGEDITLCLNGYSLTLNDPTGEESVIYILYEESLTLCDCNGTDSEHYFVYDNGSDAGWKETSRDALYGNEHMTVTGGIIVGGEYSGIYNCGILYMYGGNIVGNEAYYGGGIYNYESACYIYGGSIRLNSADWYGGGIYNERSDLYISGGLIADNAAEDAGGGIYLDVDEWNTVKLTGGILRGNYASYGGGVYAENGILEISGSLYISGNMDDSSDSGNLYIEDHSEYLMTVGTLLPGAKVGIAMIGESNYFAKLLDEAALAYLHADGLDTQIAVGTETDGTYLRLALPLEPVAHSHVSCINCTHGDMTDMMEEAYHTEATVYEPWMLSYDLPRYAGAYYLTCDVTLEYVWQVSSMIELCLNGYSITFFYSQEDYGMPLIDNSNGYFVLTDCNGSHTTRYGQWQENDYVLSNTKPQTGAFDTLEGGVLHGGSYGAIFNSGMMMMFGGIIAGNYNQYSSGGITNMEEGMLYIFGGRIVGNRAPRGGGVYNEGSFDMADGVIDNNRATERGGGLFNKGYMVLAACEIKQNSAPLGGGLFNQGGLLGMRGRPVITDNIGGNVYLPAGALIDVILGHYPLTEEAKVGVTMANPGVFTGGNQGTANKAFFSDNGEYGITLVGEELSLTVATAGYVADGESTLKGKTWQVSQNITNSAEGIRIWLLQQLEALGLAGVDHSVTVDSFTGAKIGGENGSFAVTVKLSAGSKENGTYVEKEVKLTGSITAAANDAPLNAPPAETAPETEEGNDGLPAVAIVFITIGGMLLLGGGAFALYRFVLRKKPGGKPAPDAPAEQAPAPQNEQQEE